MNRAGVQTHILRHIFYAILEAVDNFGGKIPEPAQIINPFTQAESNEGNDLTVVGAQAG